MVIGCTLKQVPPHHQRGHHKIIIAGKTVLLTLESIIHHPEQAWNIVPPMKAGNMLV